MEKQFWTVLAPRGTLMRDPTNATYQTEVAAMNAADELARLHPESVFYVMLSVSAVKFSSIRRIRLTDKGIDF